MLNRTICAFSMLILVASLGFSQVDTNFDEATLDPDVSLDIPNPGIASITLDTANDELDFVALGNTDLWAARNNSPFAWAARPATAVQGVTWSVETEMRYDTDVLSAKGRVAGITFYGGPDGDGGSSQGMDFSFGINNWDDRGDPGYQAAVEVQGLGDNSPGDAGSNIFMAPWTAANVFLRVEIIENGPSDAYSFFYKANAGDPWTLLGSMNSTVDNSRACLFLKTAAGSTVDDACAFTYFIVESQVSEVPMQSRLGLLLFIIALAATALVVLKALR